MSKKISLIPKGHTLYDSQREGLCHFAELHWMRFIIDYWTKPFCYLPVVINGFDSIAIQKNPPEQGYFSDYYGHNSLLVLQSECPDYRENIILVDSGQENFSRPFELEKLRHAYNFYQSHGDKSNDVSQRMRLQSTFVSEHTFAELENRYHQFWKRLKI